jgi:hypothetical protein
MPIIVPERTLTGIEERAVTAATAAHNRETGQALTVEAYISAKTSGFIRAMVNRYVEVVKNTWAEDYEKAPPTRQALFAAGQITLAQLRGEVPIPVQATKGRARKKG